MTVGELAATVHVSPLQLHRWRRRGLLVPEHETPGGHARYSPRDVRRARVLAALRRCGVRRGRLHARLVHELTCAVEVAVAETRLQPR